MNRNSRQTFRVVSSLCGLALALGACQTKEKEATQVAPLTPAPQATPAVTTPKADPGSLSELSLDTASSKLDIVAAKVTRSHDGAFKQFTGSAQLAGDEVQAVSFEVDTPSLWTDSDKLTGHIKTADFLDVEKFPKATFKSSSITPKPAGDATHEVKGDLTLHGVTQQITFPAKIELTPDSVTGRAEVRIDRKKFGVVYPGMPDDLIKDEVVLKPVFVFVRKKG